MCFGISYLRVCVCVSQYICMYMTKRRLNKPLIPTNQLLYLNAFKEEVTSPIVFSVHISYLRFSLGFVSVFLLGFSWSPLCSYWDRKIIITLLYGFSLVLFSSFCLFYFFSLYSPLYYVCFIVFLGCWQLRQIMVIFLFSFHCIVALNENFVVLVNRLAEEKPMIHCFFQIESFHVIWGVSIIFPSVIVFWGQRVWIWR